MQKNQWGYLRETTEAAVKAGIDKATGLHRTGLNEYLKVIFPEVDDWVHDRELGFINNKRYRCRPDYRSQSLKLIVEFDGLPHYKNPAIILKDKRQTELYNNLGYKVVRIPYFIQLSNEAVRLLFGITLNTPLFDESNPSLGIKGNNTPAFLCPLGITRMAEEFLKFPTQLNVNLNALRLLASAGSEEEILSGVDLLENQIRLLRK